MAGRRRAVLRGQLHRAGLRDLGLGARLGATAFGATLLALAWTMFAAAQAGLRRDEGDDDD